MSFKFAHGVERPLQHNAQIYAWDELSGNLKQCEFVVPTLSRHSFVPQAACDSNAEPEAMVRAVVEATGRTPTLVFAWPAPPPGATLAARARALASAFPRKGFSVAQNDGVGLATGPVVPPEFLTAPPPIAGVPCGWFVVLGDSIPADEWLRPPLQETVRVMSLTGWLHPSREFLSELAKRQMVVLYCARSANDEIGWILVQPAAFGEFTLSQVIRVFRDVDAAAAWRDGVG